MEYVYVKQVCMCKDNHYVTPIASREGCPLGSTLVAQECSMYLAPILLTRNGVKHNETGASKASHGAYAYGGGNRVHPRPACPNKHGRLCCKFASLGTKSHPSTLVVRPLPWLWSGSDSAGTGGRGDRPGGVSSPRVRRVLRGSCRGLEGVEQEEGSFLKGSSTTIARNRFPLAHSTEKDLLTCIRSSVGVLEEMPFASSSNPAPSQNARRP
eukprot:1098031-Prorocentrum_minimum.AAC.3